LRTGGIKITMKRTALLLTLLTGLTFSTFGQEINDEEIICFFGTQPTFPGGLDSLKSFLKRHVKFPHLDKVTSGKVFIEFNVTEDGSVTDIKVIKGLCDSCDRNAIEALSKMPKWIPAKQNDKPVKTRMIIPITFSL
jgi:protein TonB